MLSELVQAVARDLPFVEPGPRLLASHRRRAAGRLLPDALVEVEGLTAAVVRHEAEATTRYDRCVAHSIDRVRASRPAGPLGLLAGFDRMFYRDGEEYLDDPDFPEAERIRVIDTLDRFNDDIAAYDRWATKVDPLIERSEAAGRSPVRVHELAAGHGSFAIHLARRYGDRVEVTASDIKDEYLALGRRRADERGATVRFAHQDATDLRNLGEVDIVLCTQSLHHFPPGMVARMLGEAGRAARTGAVFIDGERSFVGMLLVSSIMLAYGRTWPVVHDTAVSLRRMYLAEELLLLARLAPALPDDVEIEAGRVAPGYAFVELSR